ncbi:methyltransferase regulatory domain-containing protein [Duganella radicis]|uniref:Methyltransferase regulatory domain-containing protein n=1 Tax=Duganella radicis TaxID=551988 RepID=A0A6L6PRH5_9BURK|nr:methyltransferase regulatory domain-containing protein [Duganella radicis]MTV41736.1 hypothetical protein [Duganella radicis]
MNWNDDHAGSPVHLSLACLLHGCTPVAPDLPFAYLAWGAGCAPALARWAAQLPHGRFYALDDRQAGAGAERDPHNLTRLDVGTDDWTAALPPLDFIVLGDDYDALAPARRRQALALIARHLQPGGLVQVRYHAMPGGASGHPLQRLLLAYQALDGATPAAAHAAVAALAEHGAGYFDADPGARAQWARLAPEQSDGWRHHEPLYFADVARAFAAAKLEFVGGADPRPTAPPLTAPQRDFLGQVADPVLRETLLDFIRNTGYRADLFVRGARPVHPLRRQSWLARCDQTLLALTTTRTAHELE